MAYLLFKMDLPTSRTNQFRQGKLHVMEGNTSIKSWTATSGYAPYQCLNDQSTRAKGPIPSCSKVGITNYSVSTSPINHTNTPGIRSNFYHILNSRWSGGKVVVNGIARSQFGIHFDDRSPGSAGCIVIRTRSEWNDCDQYLKAYRQRGHNRIDLIVQYNGSSPLLPQSQVFTVQQPTSGQNQPVNTSITFSGTAKPEVSKIIALVGPGGPFKIAELTSAGATWRFDYKFLNRGVNRPFTFQAYNSSGRLLQTISFRLTII